MTDRPPARPKRFSLEPVLEAALEATEETPPKEPKQSKPGPKKPQQKDLGPKPPVATPTGEKEPSAKREPSSSPSKSPGKGPSKGPGSSKRVDARINNPTTQARKPTSMRSAPKVTSVTPLDQADPNTLPAAPVFRIGSRRIGIIGWAVFAAFILFAVIMVADLFSTLSRLFSIHSLFGYAASALALFVGVVVIVAVLRELRSFAQLRKLGRTQELAFQAVSEKDDSKASRALRQLSSHYQRHAFLPASADTIKNIEKDALTSLEKIDVFERQIVSKLDTEASQRVSRAARDSAIFTAISPFAILDVGISLWRNLKMIREVSQVYGIAPSWFQSLRLLRRALTQVIVAGTMEAGDGLLNSLLGGGLAGRLSAKVGEGVVNGLMTTRVGVASIEQCRPLPFNALPKPKIRALASSAITSIKSMSSDGTQNEK